MYSEDADHEEDGGSSASESVLKKPLLSFQLEWNNDLKHVIACDRDSYMVFGDDGDAP